jgi:hypothetical protein
MERDEIEEITGADRNRQWRLQKRYPPKIDINVSEIPNV